MLWRPVQAAQTLASIDLLSRGRLELTVGAAFPGRFGVPQHMLSDVPWERRFTRLDETVALWRQLWAAPEGGSSFQGELLRFEALPPMTAPSRPGGPPVWLGGASESALRRTGRRYDGWMPYPPSADGYANGLDAPGGQIVIPRHQVDCWPHPLRSATAVGLGADRIWSLLERAAVTLSAQPQCIVHETPGLTDDLLEIHAM